MSGLLEADIDLGLESGAAAFDPLYCSPPTHARTYTLTHTYYPPEQTEQLLYHRAYSTPPTSRGLCALTPLKVHVRFICLTFSPPLPPSLRGSTALSNPTAIRFFHPSYSTFHARLARSSNPWTTVFLSFKLPGLGCCLPIPLAPAFHPFSWPRSLPFIPPLLAKNGNNSSRCKRARPFPRHPPRSGVKSRASSFEFLLTVDSSICG